MQRSRGACALGIATRCATIRPRATGAAREDATMTAGRTDWRTPEVEDLLAAVLRLETVPEAEAFFRDLCTLGELHDMAQRWAIVRMLAGGKHYAEISRETGASTATINRIASWLHHGEGGYQAMLAKQGVGSDA